jgi:hypothetical protein
MLSDEIFFSCCAGWGYTIAFTNVFTISNIPYLNSPLHHTTLSSHSWNSFNRYHFSIYIHIYTVFVQYSLSRALFPLTSSSNWYQLFQAGPVLFCKLKKWYFVSLRYLHREFPCDISTYVCIITQVGSCPLFFFFLP